MSDSITITSPVCFIVCDGGPAAHFAAFATHFSLVKEWQINIYANGPALTKLEDSNLPTSIHLYPFTVDDSNPDGNDQIAKQLIINCLNQGAQTIITDIGNKFDALLHGVVSRDSFLSSTIRMWSYYDNPEPYVPGGYSIKTEATVKLSRYVLFGNMNLSKIGSHIYSLPEQKIDLTNKTVRSIGYYPVEEAEKLLQKRVLERVVLRSQNNWTHVKHLFVYFGANNDAYFDQAFPMFLSSLSQIEKSLFHDVLFLLHQHPAAKKQNRDALLLQRWTPDNGHIDIAISSLETSALAQVIADGALYYQTSMAPQFALLGIPTTQVGHEIYRDLLVNHNLCHSATNATELASALQAMKTSGDAANNFEQNKQLIHDALGYTPQWPDNLHQVIFHSE